MIMKKKLFVTAFLAIALFFAMSFTTNAVVKPENTCQGYKWVSCNGQLLIRCTCTGGATCWASWQELC